MSVRIRNQIELYSSKYMCIYVILKEKDIHKKIKEYSGKEILYAYMTYLKIFIHVITEALLYFQVLSLSLSEVC